MKYIIIAIILILFVIGCGLSKEEIGETVKTSMQEKFDTDPQFKVWNLSVISVQVLAKGSNQYQGLVKILYNDTSHEIPVEITVDGNNVMWIAEPGSFLFVI